jgi:Delta3-Delta2-enoyl-CoA isomerase
MTDTGIRVTREDAVAVVTLARGDNALDGPGYELLMQTLDELAKDDGVGALVITGEGKFFGNGLHLKWMAAQPPQDRLDFLVNASRLLARTAGYEKPIIGAINGHAFGLGAIWSSGFDFRLMNADKGWVCFPEMDINIPFSPGMIAICEHGLGRQVFREMAFTATRYTGSEAVAVGWARKAVPADKLVPEAVELAAYMAKKGSVAFRFTKQAWAREVVRILLEEDPKAIRKIPFPM